jgi:hypothetical protein
MSQTIDEQIERTEGGRPTMSARLIRFAVIAVVLLEPVSQIVNQRSYFRRIENRAEEGHARALGTERRPMGTDRTDLATETTTRRSRSSMAGHTSCAERSAVDLRYRCTVAGTAEEVSTVPDLPSPLSAVGSGGKARADPAAVG